jgi:hypothetical protein
MIEFNWPEFNPKDPRWSKDSVGNYILQESNPIDGDINRSWVYKPIGRVSKWSQKDIVPGRYTREIHELIYPKGILDKDIEPNIRCSLSRQEGDINEKLLIPSSGDVWKSFQNSKNNLSTTVQVKYFPGGLIKNQIVSTYSPETHSATSIRFNYDELADGWVEYEASYRDDDPDLDKFFNELKSVDLQTLKSMVSDLYSPKVIDNGRRRLGEKIDLFKVLAYTIDYDSDSKEVQVSTDRRSDLGSESSNIYLASQVMDIDQLLESACLSQKLEWDNIIDKVKLKVE